MFVAYKTHVTKFSRENFPILTSDSERAGNFTMEKCFRLVIYVIFTKYTGEKPIDYKMSAQEEMG